MGNVGLILLVFAFVCAVIAAAWQENIGGRVNMGWAALAFYLASLLIGGVK
jgi:hypothetical protein